MKNKKINLWLAFIERLEPEVTLELEAIEHSPLHGHEICILRLVGKNSFPKMCASEILSSPKIMTGLSKNDLVKITRLDLAIKEKMKRKKIIELDRNGTIVLEDFYGKTKRYSENEISNNPEIINSLNSLDAHKVGYKTGFKNGFSVANEKHKLKTIFKQKILKLIPKVFGNDL